jgi:plasmid stabilization system protein ParE
MVKRKIIWSLQAKIDILAVLDFFYKRNGTKTYSRKLNLSLRKAIKLLENNPDIGVHTSIPNVRNLVHGNYNVFYEIKTDVIEIITIWDSRQNPEDLELSK